MFLWIEKALWFDKEVYNEKRNLFREEKITGMILLPGSFSGKISSPSPQRGPLKKEYKFSKINSKHSQHTKVYNYIYLPRRRMSLPTFIREAEIVFRAPLVSIKASCAAWKIVAIEELVVMIALHLNIIEHFAINAPGGRPIR